MIIVQYSSWGDPVSDFRCEDWMKSVLRTAKWLKNGETLNETYHVSTSLPFDYIRLAIVEGHIDCEHVLFQYNDGNGNIQDIKVNEYGAITDWPDGFCDRHIDIAEKILKEATKKRKIEEETGKVPELVDRSGL